VIYGIREDINTKRQSAYIVDTNQNSIISVESTDEMMNILKSTFGINDFETVPAHFYAENVDGGSR
jgi:hypothetical protein